MNHSVLHFDMSLGKYLDREALEYYWGRRLSKWGAVYGCDENALIVDDRYLTVNPSVISEKAFVGLK